jgi:hypothetical protein
VQCRRRLGPEYDRQKGILFDEFEEFRSEYALSDKMEANWFFRSLYDRFPGVQDSKIRVGGGRTHIISGIKIREEQKEQK